MIIESAFFKLTEMLYHFKLLRTSKKELYDSKLYESALSHFFAMSIISELNLKNIPNSFLRIQSEKTYPRQNDKYCDLWISLKDIYEETFSKTYQIFDECYCEIKFFRGIEELPNNQAPTVSENIGYILNDLSRLICFAPKESGKYLLIFFDSNKWNYIGKLQEKDGNSRPWLNEIFRPGLNQIDFNVSGEVKSLKNKITTQMHDFKIHLNTIELNTFPQNLSFNGYLIKII